MIDTQMWMECERRFRPVKFWQISAFIEHYNHHRYRESLGNVTLADAYLARHQIYWSNEPLLNARPSSIGACNTAKQRHRPQSEQGDDGDVDQAAKRLQHAALLGAFTNNQYRNRQLCLRRRLRTKPRWDVSVEA